MAEIRVTYAGLLSFVTSMISIVTGLIFMLIITRLLSPEEYGTWTLITSLILYGTIIAPIISFWNTREVTRGEESGKTAFVGSIIFSLAGILIYLLTSFFVSQQSEVKIEVLFFGAIWIPFIFINQVLNSINLGWRTHTVSYAFIVMEVSKIILALILLYQFHMGVYGVIMIYAISTMFSNFVLLYFVREKLKQTIQRRFFAKWLKLGWLPLYHPGLTSLVFKTDIIIFTIIVSSVESLSLFAAATVIGSIVTAGGTISSGLYPKLLEGKTKHVSENIRLMFYFTIPLLMIAITFSKAGLFALNPIYETAVPIAILVSFRIFFHTLTATFSQILRGNEKVDVGDTSSYKDYIRSKLFLLPSLRLIQFSIYLVTLILVFSMYKTSYSEFDFVVLWSMISVVIQIPLTIYLLFLVRKELNFKFDSMILVYTLIAIIVFSFVYYLMDENLQFQENIFQFVPNLLIYLILGIILYFGITYIVDGKTRNVVKAVLNEIK